MLPECFKKSRKAEILVLVGYSEALCRKWSHFEDIDWSEETNAFHLSEPNRNDCWCLVPPPRAQIGSNCHIFNQ